MYAIALTLMSAASALCPSAAPDGAQKIPTSAAAVSAAKLAWRGKYDDSAVQRSEPYRANLQNGAWHVFGSLPAGSRGGTPRAIICASTGQMLKVTHGR